jgi:tetratricopeptide (TPR) repeat protein
MIDLNILTGILGGSLATLIAKEILNQINKRQDFTRDLKKVTYIRKLEKAENAIAFYWTYLSKVTELKKSLEFIIQAINEIDEKDYDIEIIQAVMTNSGQAITDLSGDKYSNINSIHLYFDLEDNNSWNENDMENLIKALSETKSLDDEIKFWIDLHDNAIKVNDKRQAGLYWNKSIEILPTYVKSLQNFIDSIERNKNAMHGIVRTIKKDLKQY